MANGLEVITSTLLLAFVCVEGGVASCARQVLAIPVGNVLAVGVPVVLGQAKVYDVEVVFVVLLGSNQKVVWLYISVNHALFVALLDAHDHLYGHHAASLEIELPAASLEQVLQALAE